MVHGDDDGAAGAGLAVDEGLTRRMKALACTAPLHDLDTRKVRLDWAGADTYQMAEVACVRLQAARRVGGRGRQRLPARVRRGDQARYRTVQYAESLRRKLEATRRDVRAVDWEHEVPDLIDAALTHIAERYRAENAILDNIRRARDDAEGPIHKRRAAQLVETVGDCINRHTQRQARLLEANAVFRSSRTGSGPRRRQAHKTVSRCQDGFRAHFATEPNTPVPVSGARRPVHGPGRPRFRP